LAPLEEALLDKTSSMPKQTYKKLWEQELERRKFATSMSVVNESQ